MTIGIQAKPKFEDDKTRPVLQATLASGEADKASSTADVAKKASDALTKQVDKLAAKVG